MHVLIILYWLGMNYIGLYEISLLHSQFQRLMGGSVTTGIEPAAAVKKDVFPKAQTKGVTGSFGRLKAQRVKALTTKTSKAKRELNECDDNELEVKGAPSRRSIGSHSELEFMDEKKKLLIHGGNASRAFRRREIKDVIQTTGEIKDKIHSDKTVKRDIGKFSELQITPEKPHRSDNKIAGADVLVPRVSTANLQGWGYGETMRNFEFETTNIPKRRGKGNSLADSDFFSGKSFRDLGCSDYMIESLRGQLFVRPSHIQVCESNVSCPYYCCCYHYYFI